MTAVEKFFAVFLGELSATAVTVCFKEDGEAHNDWGSGFNGS